MEKTDVLIWGERNTFSEASCRACIRGNWKFVQIAEDVEVPNDITGNLAVLCGPPRSLTHKLATLGQGFRALLLPPEPVASPGDIKFMLRHIKRNKLLAMALRPVRFVPAACAFKEIYDSGVTGNPEDSELRLTVAANNLFHAADLAAWLFEAQPLASPPDIEYTADGFGILHSCGARTMVHICDNSEFDIELLTSRGTIRVQRLFSRGENHLFVDTIVDGIKLSRIRSVTAEDPVYVQIGYMLNSLNDAHTAAYATLNDLHALTVFMNTVRRALQTEEELS